MRIVPGRFGLLALLVCLVLSPSAQGFRQRSFSARVDAVRLDVFVRLDRPSLHRLTVEDFEVLEDGKRHSISLMQSESIPINVVLVLDTSRSTRGAPFNDTVRAVHALIDRLRPDDRISVLTFDDLVHTHIRLTSDIDEVRARMASLGNIGRSSILDSLVAGLSVATATTGRTLLLVCSDGIDNTSVLSRDAVDDVVRGSEAVLYTVLTGPGRSLDGLAELSGGYSVRARGTNLSEAFEGVIEQFRTRYLLSFYVQPSSTPEWRRIEVRLRGRAGRVHHRAGYWLTPAK